jgi:hypothetical protein
VGERSWRIGRPSSRCRHSRRRQAGNTNDATLLARCKHLAWPGVSKLMSGRVSKSKYWPRLSELVLWYRI